MVRKKDCEPCCVCNICCGKTGNRAECACRCNKCCLAKTRVGKQQADSQQQQDANGPRRQPGILPKPLRFIEQKLDLGLRQGGKRKQEAPKTTATPKKKKYEPDLSYSKEIEEHLDQFCYDEDLALRHVNDQLPSTKEKKKTPDSHKGMHFTHAPLPHTQLFHS